MPDYTMGTGVGGVMLIRDQGWNVEFHIRAGFDSTFTYDLRWQRYVNGAWSGQLGPRSYSTGRPWIHLDTFAVTYNQTIYFRLEDTDTQGLGGPTDFPQWIQRATVPPAPTPMGLDQIGHTEMRYRFTATLDGGSPIREFQIGYGTDPSHVQFTTPSNGTSIIRGMTVGTIWYFWVRARNDVGWGPWSSRSQARTLSTARVRVAGVHKETIGHVKFEKVWRQAIAYKNINGVWTLTKGN